PAVEPNGLKVIFLSDADLLLNGTSGPRLFAIDFKNVAHIFYQVTGRGTILGRIGASLGAWFATFDSDDDVGGYGICGRQIWIVTYDPGHYTEAGHQRLAVSVLGQVPGEPPRGNPNDSCDDADGCSVDTCIGGQICMHAPEPEGFKCAPGDQCNGGVSMCVQGTCTLEPQLDCDDQDKCTDDTCDPNTGCGHTQVDCDDGDPCTVDTCDSATGCAHDALPKMDGLSCQNQVVVGLTPSKGNNKQVLKNLRRAQKLVQQASQKKARGAKRKLKQAQNLFNQVLPDINTTTLPISREQATDLIVKIYSLLDQIASVLKDLQPSK